MQQVKFLGVFLIEVLAAFASIAIGTLLNNTPLFALGAVFGVAVPAAIFCGMIEQFSAYRKAQHGEYVMRQVRQR